jgi:hypothetical protein
LHNAFVRAENPHRIYIRVLEQTLPDSEIVDDDDCWKRYCQDYNTDCMEFENNVHTVWQDASTAKGPTDARSKLSAMIYWDHVHRNDPSKLDFQRVESEDFCMETDSHMDFSTHYDTELILMHHRTKNDFAVLSTYVADISQNNVDPDTVPNLCMVKFTSTIRNWGTKECVGLVTPKLTNAMWGAGLSFHRCHAELNVPVDPYVSGVFDGEEGSRGLRFFTHGYDVYTPDRVLVTHDYQGHQSNPVVHTWGRQHDKAEPETIQVWRSDIEEMRPNVTTIGTKRVNMMLGIGTDEYSEEERHEIQQMRASRFGLGTKRTLEQAIEFSGINLRERKMEMNRCGNLEWVPYEENLPSDYYGLGEILGRGLIDGGTGIVSDTGNVHAALRESRNLNTKQAGSGLRVGGALVVVAFVLLGLSRGKLRKKDERHKH